MHIRNKPILFYQNLGQLFYAFAATDKCIKEEEIIALKTMIDKHWSIDPNSNNIEIYFNNLKKESTSSKKCFESFLSYKKENEFLFTNKIKQLIMRTAGEITNSFSNRNKSELIMLGQLEIAFRK